MPRQYNPETILQEQFESQRQLIQQQYRTKWDEVNRRGRMGLFKSIKDRDAAIFELHTESTQVLGEFDYKAQQAMSQLKQIDQLTGLGALSEQDAFKAKWKLVLPKETEAAMFPKPRDLIADHNKVFAELSKVRGIVDSYVLGKDDKLYEAKLDSKKIYVTDQPDKSKPATPEEQQLWLSSVKALDVLGQTEQTIVQKIAESGTPNPNRLQSLMVSTEKEHWAKRAIKATAKGYYATTGIGLIHRGVKDIKKMLGTEPTGTFAQKVQQDIAKSQTQQPQRKRSRQELLTEYRKLGGSRTSEGRAFADRNFK